MSEIRIMRTDKPKAKPEIDGIPFGTYFSDHMFLMDYHLGQGWVDPRIVPYGPISLEPSAMVLHYAQEIFEGLKAYRTAEGKIQLFRPYENAKRFNRSAARFSMPEIPEEDFVQAVLHAVDGVVAGFARSLLHIVGGDVAHQCLYHLEGFLLGGGGEMCHTALRGVHGGASKVLLVHVLAGDGLHHLRACEEHV